MVARLLTPAALFALALAIRLLPWPTVMEKSQVVYFGMDAWYHMRRVRLALALGWPPFFDPYLNFPHGAMPIWPPLFDAVTAAWVLPAWVAGDWLAVERAAALLPPLLGAGCVVVLYRLALRLFDRPTAVLAALALCLLSAHFWYSQIGFVDHHAATALVVTMLLASALRLIERLEAGGSEAGASETGVPLREALVTGALGGLALVVWPGAILHLGIVGVALGLLWLTRADRDSARRVAATLFCISISAFAVVLPFAWTSGWEGARAFSPAVLSGFQPWLLGGLAGVAGISLLLWRRARGGETSGSRLGTVLSLLGALLGGSAMAFPELREGLAEAWRWFAKDEIFQGLVKESKPLFFDAEGFDRHNAELRLSRWLYLAPGVWGWWVWRARSSPRRTQLLLVAGWAGVLIAATLLQRRFFNSLAPVHALAIAVATRELLSLVPRVVPRPGASQRAVRALVVVIALALFAPTLAAYRTPLTNLQKRVRGEPMTVPKNEISRRALIETARWIAANTPPTAGPLDPAVTPEYGLLAPWGYGHLLKYVAQRPTVVGNFGDDVGEANLRRVTAYFASTEPDAVRILDDLRARYVLVNTLGEVPPERLQGAAMRKRLSQDDSLGLRHHRLVYESPLDERWGRIGRSEFRVFERVAGARVVGHAHPGAQVVARLDYTSSRARRGHFTAVTTADGAGRYELRIPYATRGGPPGTRPARAVQLRAGGRLESVEVPESAVREGTVVLAPDFRRASGS